MDRQVFDHLQLVLLNTFPDKAHCFPDSLAANLLSRFCHYFWFLGLPLRELNEHHKTVQLAPAALRSLSTTSFPSDMIVDLYDGEFSFLPKKQSQRSRKKSFRQNRTTTLDKTLFEKLDLFVPETKDDADMVEGALLHDLQRILKLYLETLRDPDAAEPIKKAYMGDQNDVEPETAINTQVITSTVNEPIANECSEIPAAYPFIQPMKAAFHFDSVEGFGEWRILISTRADRNLRESKKKNPKLFAIILKKIKCVSHCLN
ncbi:hypothetical protein EIP86_006379 [Pleurotus ostreatoroseus]|nr:hypothetical protein EIP86_006379 [Pleurotus ostreatoroseus]